MPDGRRGADGETAYLDKDKEIWGIYHFGGLRAIFFDVRMGVCKTYLSSIA